MSSGFCDLHTHTTASDGSLVPERLLDCARRKGLRAVGICDHDTVSGVLSLYGTEGAPDVRVPLIRDGVEVIPGVEINSLWRGHEVHILGYYVPFGKGPFQGLLDRMRFDREGRVRRMVDLLHEQGMDVDLSRVMDLSTGDSVGRPHVAQAMVDKGYAASIKDAFERFLGAGKPAYVQRAHLTPQESVRAISSAGGVAVWAHPGTSGSMHLLPGLVSEGLRGIEAYHPEHNRSVARRCADLASRHGLVATGGSDYHGEGSGEGGDLGSTVVPYGVVTALKTLASTKR